MGARFVAAGAQGYFMGALRMGWKLALPERSGELHQPNIKPQGGFVWKAEFKFFLDTTGFFDSILNFNPAHREVWKIIADPSVFLHELLK